jgi:hypothetical protein
MAGSGAVWQAWFGAVVLGWVRQGSVWCGRYGMARYGWIRSGKAGFGRVRLGAVWQVRPTNNPPYP